MVLKMSYLSRTVTDMISPKLMQDRVQAVEVDDGAVHRMANEIRAIARRQGRSLSEESWSDPLFWNVNDSRSDRCQYLALGNAINFRFWSLRGQTVVPAVGEIAGEQLRGAMYMWRRLRLAVQREELTLVADDLAGIDEVTFRKAFLDDAGHLPLSEGISDRVENIKNLGLTLARAWDGSWANVVDAAGGSLNRFAVLSATFRAFDDPVQKLTMLNAIMLQGSGLTKFDRAPLPAIDYHLVKQATRQGLVNVRGPIAAKLRDGQLLSRAESDLLRMAVRQALVDTAANAEVSTAVLDNIYWLNRRVCADTTPDCDACPFRADCAKKVEFGLPLEVTRYY
ncbi:hypothetical protein BN971_01838 [Mycobacterium bohemicum DSM 44277]|nr:hypothetical protein BN971_01838 [Mycobacterium bohemicum DSM 44277]